MDFSQIKWVVSDLDGTLLNNNHEVSTRFLEQFEQLKSNGIRFIAASGRQYGSMVQKLAPIYDEITIIAENGSLIRQGNETLHQLKLDTAHLVASLALTSQLDKVSTILCAPDMAYVFKPSREFIGIMSEYYSEYTVIEEIQQAKDPVLKVALHHPESSEIYIYPHTIPLEKEAMVKVSGQYWVDVSHQNANKGFALKKLMGQEGISPNEVMVFGDFNNDLEMLSLTPNSFAMANAHPEVKRVAQYETKSNEEGGVETIIEELIRAI